MRMLPGVEVQSVIAHHLLGRDELVARLGNITLHPHQRDGVERARRLLDTFGGALLADDVGLGKTFVALAVARGAADPVVVAPAALREAWADASRRTSVPTRFISLEMLARGHSPAGVCDLVVIDEAHHLRNSGTRRFAAARRLCANARVLLLSATPVQNRIADLRVIMSLFLGERAHAMSMDALGGLIIRRVGADLGESAALALPAVDAPQWLHPTPDIDCLERLLALPPPLSPADAGDGGVLLTYTLVRQWASSRAALRAALGRRLARAHALEDALMAGRLPSRLELSAWCFADGSQQLAFPTFAVASPVADAARLLDQVRLHRAAIRDLSSWLSTTDDPDGSRVDRLRELLEVHAGQRVVAFSEYVDTVTALYRRLAPSVRAAMLTHAGGRVVGGRLTRNELLARFAPGAGARSSERDRIDLLLTTDVLSEGVNLQDASVVVHLDLPWNPARIAQRVGRLCRIGARQATVSAYAMAPPAPAERMLQLERRLRIKLGDAARAVGLAGAILPGVSPPDADDASARRAQRVAAILTFWRGPAPETSGALVCGAVRASRDAALACVRREGSVQLIACDTCVTDSPALVEALLASTQRESVEADINDARRVQNRVAEWLRRRQVTDVIDLPTRRVARCRRDLLLRADAIARRAPRHTEAALSPLLFAARSAATAPLSAGAERVLDELTHASLGDTAWLQALGEFATLHAARSQASPSQILALLLLRAPERD